MSADMVGKTVAEWQARGWTCAFARVAEVRGVGSAAAGELFARSDAGDTVGGLLGGAVDDAVRLAADRVLGGPTGVEALDLVIDGDAAGRAGLRCGGSVTVVVQRARGIPWQLWSTLAERRPVALATLIADHVTEALVAADDGSTYGSLGAPDLDIAAGDAAGRLLAAGETATTRLEIAGRAVLIDAFVPEPHLVIVGGGALSEAIADQVLLLGWPATIATDVGTASASLAEAGASAGLVMLSHSP